MSWNLFDYQEIGKIDIYILIHKEFVFIPIYARGIQAKNLISENKASILINMMCDNLACICFVAVSSISLISSSEGGSLPRFWVGMSQSRTKKVDP